jgi:hypothetical protein
VAAPATPQSIVTSGFSRLLHTRFILFLLTNFTVPANCLFDLQEACYFSEFIIPTPPKPLRPNNTKRKLPRTALASPFIQAGMAAGLKTIIALSFVRFAENEKECKRANLLARF